MQADDPTLVLEMLPLECLVEILSQLSVADVLNASEASKPLHEASTTDFLWRQLCVRGQHGQSLDFNETLGTFRHPDAQPVASSAAGAVAAPAPPAIAAASSSSTDWRAVFRKSRSSLRTTVCIDGGRGYAKYGFAHQPCPSIIQICTPGAEANPESMFALAFRRLRLQRTDLPQHALIVSEPFKLAAEEAAQERLHWRLETEQRLLQVFQLKAVAIVDSASLCLFARSLTSGVVVNIGFGATFVVPVLRGHVIRRAVRTLRVGGAALTSLFAELCHMRDHDASWSPAMGGDVIADITVARNIKELGCEAHPTPLRHMTGHSPFELARVFSMPPPELKTVRLGEVEFHLGWERYLPAELLLDPGEPGPSGGPPLQRLIMEAINATCRLEQSGELSGELSGEISGEISPELAVGARDSARDSPRDARGRQRSRHDHSLKEALLGRVVLSGGSSSMQGLPERLQYELAELFHNEDGGPKSAVVVAPPEPRDGTTWKGASVLAGTSTFAEHWCVHAPPDAPMHAHTNDPMHARTNAPMPWKWDCEGLDRGDDVDDEDADDADDDDDDDEEEE
jgi:hypothetical protein